MRILILNWRDPSNPQAGGAEVVTMELARAWCSMGHEVTWFAASFPGAAAEDDIDGVRITRRGRSWTVHWAAYRAYRRGELTDFDVVIDQVHGIGFCSALYVREARLLFIHEVAGRIWLKMYPLPIALIGMVVERLMLRRFRSESFITVSESTRQDLLRVGVPDDRITVVHWGVTFEPPMQLPPKEPLPTIISVGRICAMKQTVHVIEAFALFRQQHPDAQLWLVGDGDRRYLRKCRARVAALGLTGTVTFFGFVDSDWKRDLLGRSWVLASASMKEGWGLVVAEANAMGTPVAVYDVPGFRDSVAEGWGELSLRTTPSGLAAAIDRAIRLPRPQRLPERGNSYEQAAVAVLAAAFPSETGPAGRTYAAEQEQAG